MEERFDRLFANIEWDFIFLYGAVRYLEEEFSDYLVILLELNYISIRKNNRRRRGFKFDNMWVCETGCEAVI